MDRPTVLSLTSVLHYRRALFEIDQLLFRDNHNDLDEAAADRLGALAEAIEEYESEHYPLGASACAEADMREQS